MSIASVARDAATATLFVAYLGSIERDPRRWQFPESTASYLQWRVVDIAAALIVHDAGTGVAA